ncbi:MAG: ABC transporter permease subunit [Leptolyngbya sp. PLA3]|nr:MAG: ABC transporter permease subunit [Cyanobacteria bacterium CYA]MCE7968116.1 ABC transporter permease subunit [Leptolyngbya sp. PL-A3]
MIGRFLGSRGVRRFRRSRMAMVSLAVIGAYFAAAVAVTLGVISRDDTKMRVGPNRFPGLLERIDAEKRYEFDKWYVGELSSVFGRAQRAGDKDAARKILDAFALGERRIAAAPAGELIPVYESMESAWKELDEALAVREDLSDERFALRADAGEQRAAGTDSSATEARLSEVEERLTEVRPRVEALYEQVESAIEVLLPMPEGVDGLVYRLRIGLGTDSKGASISSQAVYSVKIAFQVGFVTALLAVLIGTILGASAAFFGGWVDHLVLWIVSTLSSIPYLVLLAVFVYVFQAPALAEWFDNPDRPGLALVPLYAAFGMTFWIGTCRVVRGEVMKIKELEYVQAAMALGFGRFYILLRHIIPNTAHIMFINFSLLFIGAIKSEVILTFLGLGVKGQPSWGIMISHGADGVTNFFFWEVGAATVFMFVLVLAFNIVSDALQDAFDPKHV